MPTYVLRKGELVLKSEAGPPAGQGPNIIRDLPAYKSPLGTGWVDGRAARREELKRHGCREVEPSEFKPVYHNERFARKHGLPYTPRE